MSEKIPMLNPLECALNEAQAFREQVELLQAENSKLRELCEYLWEFAKTCGADHPFLRELGVDDG